MTDSPPPPTITFLYGFKDATADAFAVLVDIVVVDSIVYCDMMHKCNLERANQAPTADEQGTQETSMRNLQLGAIQGFFKRQQGLAVGARGIKVVTLDYVLHCMQVKIGAIEPEESFSRLLTMLHHHFVELLTFIDCKLLLRYIRWGDKLMSRAVVACLLSPRIPFTTFLAKK